MKKLDERSTSWTSSPRELVVQSCPRIGTSYDRCVFHLLSLEVVGPFLERAAVLDAEGYGIEVLESLDAVRCRSETNCQRCAWDFKRYALHRAVFNEFVEQPEPQRPHVPLATSGEVAHRKLDVVHTQDRSSHVADYLFQERRRRSSRSKHRTTGPGARGPADPVAFAA